MVLARSLSLQRVSAEPRERDGPPATRRRPSPDCLLTVLAGWCKRCVATGSVPPG